MDEPRPPVPRARWRGLLHGAVGLVGWPAVSGYGLFAASRLFEGWVGPSAVQALLLVFPLTGLAPLVALVAALPVKRWFLAGAAALLTVAHLVAVAPALGSDPIPSDARSAPSFTVAQANIYLSNESMDDAAETLMALDADVLVITENTPEAEAALTEAGADEAYRYRASNGEFGAYGTAMWSRLPLGESVPLVVPGTPPLGRAVRVGGTEVDLFGVHPLPPLDAERRVSWRAQLEAYGELAGRADRAGRPLLIVGDLNATRWHPPLTKLLGSLNDIHESRGEGLSRSWPANYLVRMGRLDHGLVNGRVVPLDVRDVAVPGSDHLGFVTTLAVVSG